jgi:ketosteroid isomerase-like protein
MKITIVAITALIVAAAPFVLAQEETSSPGPSPEASASDPTVSVTTEKTAPPAPKSESSPSPAKTSPPATSKTSPAATPANASPAAVTPAKKSTPEATIKDIEDKWEASVMSHDPAVAQAYLADDYRGVSSKGKLMSKSNLLSELKKDTDSYTSTKNGKVDVRVFGGQFAVAIGTSTEAGKAKDGNAFKRTFRWTDVWVLRKDKWLCVASQAVLVQ